MSTPDPNPNPSVSVPVSRPIVTASESPVTQTNAVRTPSSQPPPPAPSSYRAIAPVHRYPHPHQNHYTHPLPIRRSNPVAGSPHQPHLHPDPSSLIYPFGSSGRGFPTRPARPVADPVGSPGGYRPRPVYAYHHGQFGSNLDPMVQQYMRAPLPQNQQQSPQLGSGHMKGVPHFLQPRATPSPTSILDNIGHKKARSRDDALVLVRKRKVRISEGASLYSLCRSWLRNGAHEGIQPQRSDTMTCLPKPLPADTMETSLPKDSVEEPNNEEDKEDEESVKHLSEADLLKRHVDRAKKVRARLREERSKRIARYKARLALLLPPFGEQCRNE
ncbi:PREDICTED: chromosome alignment-maintaining phosphoprotein 1-like isoform X1 [Camelina sativa]|uniref:Chromosome alignment-maintaining phosphoprotein 1-like isoform X1 n=1 Tax=Camelina sativa TaxID=90675 RepID=A0ABM0WDI7_CAMSA|nr:PREDICTED: chromosome alignment-maintaining phosphoprotein 1-like isoform X1 [Camelina sativa]